jgi:hypothetical protein
MDGDTDGQVPSAPGSPEVEGGGGGSSAGSRGQPLTPTSAGSHRTAGAPCLELLRMYRVGWLGPPTP